MKKVMIVAFLAMLFMLAGCGAGPMPALVQAEAVGMPAAF